MFQLIQPTTVKLMHINVRTEKHGPADVDAFDLDFAISGENRKVLALLRPDLYRAFYFNEEAEEGQDELPEVDPALPDLKFPKLASSFAWADEATGVDLTVIYGLGDEVSNIALEGGKAATKKVDLMDGGTSVLGFKFSISGYPDGVIDKLRKKLKQDVTITMVRPEKLRGDAVIDGTVGHPGAAAAAEGQGDLLDGAETPEQALMRAAGDDTGPDQQDDGADDGEGNAPDADADADGFEAGAAQAIAAAGVKQRGTGAKRGKAALQ